MTNVQNVRDGRAIILSLQLLDVLYDKYCNCRRYFKMERDLNPQNHEKYDCEFTGNRYYCPYRIQVESVRNLDSFFDEVFYG